MTAPTERRTVDAPEDEDVARLLPPQPHARFAAGLVRPCSGGCAG